MSNLRKLWRAFEAIHTVVYFAPEAKTAYKSIGLPSFWMGYFASRSAALGTPSAELVTATFYGFAPTMVAKAIPAAWALAERDDILAARAQVARRALQEVIGDDERVREQAGAAADQLLEAVADLSYAGRSLAAAHRALPTPAEPLTRLWHATSVLREYRGDGHLAALSMAGLGPVDSNIVQVALGKALDGQQSLRGWSDEEWAAGRTRLVQRGWIDEAGALTELGNSERESIEAATDQMSDEAITALGATSTAETLLGWGRAISHSPIAPKRSGQSGKQ